MKRTSWFEILLVIAVMSISLYAALSDAQNLSMRWFVRDDAYYYFKVAQNISEGKGSTFDGINLTNGYHPLWLWVCVPIFALARFDLILPLRILLLTMSGLSVATAILLYRLIGRVFAPTIGAIIAIYWAFSTDILDRVYQQGLETGIAAFFIVLFVYKMYEFEKSRRNNPVTNKQLAVLGVIAVFTVFSRLDLIFLAGIIGIWIVFRGNTLRYFLPLDIVSVVVSVLLGFFFRISFREYLRFADVATTMIAVGLVVKITGAFLLGLYQRPVSYKDGQLRGRILIFSAVTAMITGLIMIFVSPLAGFEGFPRTIILYDFLLTTAFFGITRYAAIGLQSNRSTTSDDPSPMAQLKRSWRGWVREGTVYYGIIGSAVGLYMVMNKIHFGTSFPVSGQIKRWWGGLSGRVYGGSTQNTFSFFGFDSQSDGNAWHPISSLISSLTTQISSSDITFLFLLFICAATFYLMLHINRSKAKTAILETGIIPLACGAWLQLISYHITGYSAYKEWYWIGQLVTEIILVGIILGMLYNVVRKHSLANTLFWPVTIIFSLAMAGTYWQRIQRTMLYDQWTPKSPYNEIAALLEEHTEPGSIIGMTGGGNAGYFAYDRIVVNMDGLINSYEYFQFLKNRTAGDYLEKIDVDYIFANPEILSQLPYTQQFDTRLHLSSVWFGGKNLMRYQVSQP